MAKQLSRREAERRRFRGTRFDGAAIQQLAAAELGIKGSVSVRRRRLACSWGWAQSFPRLTHNIVIDSGHNTVASALRTLMHELTHAQQAERILSEAGWEAWLIATSAEAVLLSDRGAYDNAPLEREAIAAEERWDLLLPAIKG